MRLRPLVALPISAALLACSLLVDLSGLQGAADASPDAGLDAITDAALVGCVGVDALLCEDFEHGLQDGWTVDLIGDGASVTVDDAFAGSGAFSMLAHTGPLVDAGPTNALLDRFITLPPTAYVRFSAWLPAIPSESANLLYLQQSDSGLVMSLGVQPTGVLVLHHGGGAPDALGTTVLDALKWTCITLAITPTKVTVSLGPNAEILDGLDGSPIGWMAVGLRFPGGSASPANARIDDVIVSTTPYPCP